MRWQLAQERAADLGLSSVFTMRVGLVGRARGNMPILSMDRGLRSCEGNYRADH